MKKLNSKILTIALLSTLSFKSEAYTIVVFTDQQDVSKAMAELKRMGEVYPLNKFDIDFKIARVKPEQLQCSLKSGIDRLLTCKESQDKIKAAAAKLGADDVLVIKDHHEHGGGASVASTDTFATSSTKSSLGTLMHEYMHNLGFTDEYTYPNETEANKFCNSQITNSLNRTFIIPDDLYANDASARSKHSRQIPWYSQILTSTLITNSGQKKLGTQVVPYGKSSYALNTTKSPTPLNPVGLYPMDTCKHSKLQKDLGKTVVWKPSSVGNIMGNSQAGIGNLEQDLERALIKRGMKYKGQQSASKVTPVNSINNTNRYEYKPLGMPSSSGGSSSVTK